MGQVNDICKRPCYKSAGLEHGHVLSPNNIMKVKKRKTKERKGKYY